MTALLAAAVLSALVALAAGPAAAEAPGSAEAAIRARIVYLAVFQDVTWFEVSGSELHIGFRGPVIDNVAILEGAVAVATGVAGPEVEVRGHGYDARRWGYRSRAAGADCVTVGQARIKRTECLIDGAWVALDRP
jgi:hypothetical protein